jgi:uroporphyrinogen decarboxylase
MNDNPYDLPADMPVIKTIEGWSRLEPLRRDAPGFVGQLEGLRILREELGDLYMTTTIFGPFAQAQRLCGKKLQEHLAADRDKVAAGLDVVTESLSVLAAACIQAGADGIYLACSGSAEGELSEADYRELIRPRDIKVLRSAAEGDFNFVHIHGNGCPFDIFANYPGDAIGWTSTSNPPSLAAARSMTSMCLVGGWEQEGAVATGDVEGVREETRQALAATGGKHFMLGPGCTIPSDTPEANIRAAIQSARELG